VSMGVSMSRMNTGPFMGEGSSSDVDVQNEVSFNQRWNDSVGRCLPDELSSSEIIEEEEEEEEEEEDEE